MPSGAILSTDLTVSAAAGARFDVAVTDSVDVSGCIDPHIGADSVADPEATNGARSKKGRKAESMGMATAELLEVPEKKMRRADGVLLVVSEAASANETAATPRPSNWATMTPSQKSMWRKRTKRRNK